MKDSLILFFVVTIGTHLGDTAACTAGMLTVTDDSGFIKVDQGPISSIISRTSTTLNFQSAPSPGFVSFIPPSDSLTINLGGGGANTVNVNSLPVGFLAPTFVIKGNDGPDRFNINTLHGGGPYTIAADGGFDTLDVSGLGGSLFDTGSSITLNGNTIINYSGIDSVVGAESTVPEPSSMALLGMGALTVSGYAWRRRRRRTQRCIFQGPSWSRANTQSIVGAP